MSKLIVLDGSHGGKDPGAVGSNGLKEKDVSMKIIEKVVEQLIPYDVEVAFTRTSDVFIELSERAAIANRLNADCFISIHCNSFSDPKSNGTETFTYTKVDSKTVAFAESVHNNLVNSIKLRDRGIKQADYAVLRETNMIALLLEIAFISNPEECKLLGDEAFINKVSRGIVNGITSCFKLSSMAQGTPIISKATATLEQCQEWAKAKSAKQTFIENAKIYFKLCNSIGINPVMAYAQYALESGYGHHKGTVPESYCNPCGLKVAAGGGDTEKDAHMQFENWEKGISAHVDHIALYVGVDGYPKEDSLDPRHFSYLYGKYNTVEAIGKGWCPSNPAYGDTLLKFMGEIKQTKVIVKNEHKDNVKLLHANGIINTIEVWENEEDINIEYVPALIKQMADYFRCRV